MVWVLYRLLNIPALVLAFGYFDKNCTSLVLVLGQRQAFGSNEAGSYLVLELVKGQYSYQLISTQCRYH
jgi:hypothetical protein